MKLGIIGLPAAGKTTIFNAIARSGAPTGQNVGGRFDVNQAIVQVPDPRVNVLSDMFNLKKTTFAQVAYEDIAGIQQGASDEGGFSPAVMNHLAGLDGYLQVARAFESDLVPHPAGSVDAQRDINALNSEMALSDLIIVENKLSRLADGLSKGAFKNKGEAQIEQALFQRLQAALSEEQPLRELTLTAEEEKSLRGYGFLTLKPMLIIINLGDEQAEIPLDDPSPNTLAAQLRGKLEMELAHMEGEDLEMFMTEYGVTELGLDRAIRLSYQLMGLQSFFTVGEDEVRAWAIKQGATAVDAAGTIHSDMAKGFIRAEVVHYDELMAAGSVAEARNAGKYRLEGKGYLPADGDLINIKFNV